MAIRSIISSSTGSKLARLSVAQGPRLRPPSKGFQSELHSPSCLRNRAASTCDCVTPVPRSFRALVDLSRARIRALRQKSAGLVLGQLDQRDVRACGEAWPSLGRGRTYPAVFPVEVAP